MTIIVPAYHLICLPLDDKGTLMVLEQQKQVTIMVSACYRNLPFGGRVTWGSQVHLPWEENAWSHHQRLFEENVRKTGKGVVYKL